MIILNNGHTPLSPGAVYEGITEYRESKRLIEAIRESLDIPDVKITEGTGGYSPDGLLFIFHKGCSEKNENKHGAEITVSEDASADTQYKAYKLLSRLCGECGFRFRGVHTLTEKSPFRTLFTLGNENAYLIKTGYIDSVGDRLICDREFPLMVKALSREIKNIYEENKNEYFS